jgi:hypothetical protein
MRPLASFGLADAVIETVLWFDCDFDKFFHIHSLVFSHVAKKTCSQKIDPPRSKRTTGTSLLFRGIKFNKRHFPWAGAFFHKESFYCGGNLSKFYQGHDFLLQNFIPYRFTRAWKVVLVLVLLTSDQCIKNLFKYVFALIRRQFSPTLILLFKHSSKSVGYEILHEKTVLHSCPCFTDSLV